MGILEKLGLAQKKKQGAPVIGEKKKRQEEASSLKYNVYLRSLIIFVFLGILFLSVPHVSFKEPGNYAINQPWRADDLTAPFNFAIKKSDEEIEQERETIRKTTPPIFYMKSNARISVQSSIDSLFRTMQPVLEAYLSWQQAKLENNRNASRDSLKYMEARNTSGIKISQTSWEALLQNYRNVNLPSQNPDTKTAPQSQFVGVDLKGTLEMLANELLNDGIINVRKSDLSNEEITVRNLQTRTERTLNTANVRDLQEAREYAQYRLSRQYFEDVAQAGIELFRMALEANYIYDAEETQARIQEALSNISSTKGAVTKDEVIIRRGDIVTPEKYQMLQSLAEAKAQTASVTERWLQYGGDILSVLAIVTIFFFYLFLYRKYIFEDNSMLLLVLLAISIISVASSLVYEFENISAYVVPVAVAPIILTIIFDSRVGLMATITLALLIGLINGNNFEFVTATTVACSLGLFSVRDIKKRSQFFFTTPGIVFASYAIVLIAFDMTSFEGWDELLNDMMFVGINAIFILFTYPLILLFEKTFKVTTDFTLLELSDTNLPLLKELMTKAPGSFHHSLQVANLAETAAGAIGANGLLCRVGALYHDIGKMENPGYFTENQAGPDEHEKLKPRMSALVIKAHVSNGVKIANEHNLPEVVIDFIKTHHGTSLIKFFFQKAKEKSDSNKDEIKEEDFRYDGPLPRSKETGILMLADGVEAASRSLKDPNYQKLESLVNKMVDDRVNEGQLSQTPLTFQDLRTIKKTFLNILVGIYHSRVKYPGDEEEDLEGEQGTQKPDQAPVKDGEIPREKDTGQEPESEEEEPPQVDRYYNT